MSGCGTVAVHMERFPAGRPRKIDDRIIARFIDWPTERLGFRPSVRQLAALLGVTEQGVRDAMSRVARGRDKLHECNSPGAALETISAPELHSCEISTYAGGGGRTMTRTPEHDGSYDYETDLENKEAPARGLLKTETC